MKPGAILISLLFFAQLGGCAHAHNSGCKSQENRSDCPKVKKDTKELKEPKEDSTARRRVTPSGIERSQPMPPLTIKREQASPQVPSPPKPTAPLPTSSCDAGGCWDNSANRYSGGAAGTYLDNSGRPCHRVGSWMQCF